MSVPSAPVTTEPRMVRISALLYTIGAVIGLVGAVVLLVTLPAALDATRAGAGQALQGQDTNGVDVEGVLAGTVIGTAIFSTVLTIAFSVLTILFARKMRAGANWARVVLAVFAVLQIFGALGAYGVGAIHFLLVLVALILSFLPESNAWFRTIKAQRTPAL